MFPRSAASCGAESFQHGGRKARTAESLARYVAEFDCRRNSRKATDGERTVEGIRKAQGKRLTMNDMVRGRAEAEFMERALLGHTPEVKQIRLKFYSEKGTRPEGKSVPHATFSSCLPSHKVRTATHEH